MSMVEDHALHVKPEGFIAPKKYIDEDGKEVIQLLASIPFCLNRYV